MLVTTQRNDNQLYLSISSHYHHNHTLSVCCNLPVPTILFLCTGTRCCPLIWYLNVLFLIIWYDICSGSNIQYRTSVYLQSWYWYFNSLYHKLLQACLCLLQQYVTRLCLHLFSRELLYIFMHCLLIKTKEKNFW